MATQSFMGRITESGTGASIEIPFDPDEIWGAKDRHYVSGSIDGFKIRGCLDEEGNQLALPLGPAWLRDNPVAVGAEVEVVLAPDGHLAENVAPDIGAALNAEPQARTFFESVAPFYRNNYIRWIESAKRPETRASRIKEMMELLKARQKQK